MSASPGESPESPRTAIVFTGHMVDAPDRPVPRFPATLVEKAAARIASALAGLDAGASDVALTQGAAGGDLLFSEACLARGVPLRLLLPLAHDEFVARSLLSSADGEAWLSRHRAVVARIGGAAREAPAVLGPLTAGEDPFERGNRWLLAEARALHAQQLVCMCLWDGGAGDGRGGTRDLVDAVRAAGGRVVQIDTRTL